MLSDLPIFVSLVFVLTTLLTFYVFAFAVGELKRTIALLSGWLLLVGIVSYNGFYANIESIPPRLPLTMMPVMITLFYLLLTKRGRHFISKFNLKWLTFLHVVRIPVEIVLFWLFLEGKVPQIMTFEGWNFDIIAGITAPLIWYFGFIKKKLSNRVILVWNILCLLLLMNIVSLAILSLPYGFQFLSFDQPNLAVLYFPFVWLPTFIVPIVALSHLTAILRLLKIKA